jgi:CIC family chloride channel protein
MVAEMTGGYALLVPAGLAVLLSYIVQYNLSRFFKYPSLYEAQLPDRADSPAHQAEYIRTAMSLLDHANIVWPGQVTHLQLVSLLQSGFALDLPDGSTLTAAVLTPDGPLASEQHDELPGNQFSKQTDDRFSSWIGKKIQSRPPSDAVTQTRILAVLRGHTVLTPRPDTVLQSADRLLIIAPPETTPAH